MTGNQRGTAALAGLFATLAASGATAALAADLEGPRRGRGGYDYPPPLERPYHFSRWTGLYLGGTLGYGWGTGEAGGDIGAVSFDQSGTIGTIFAGYNWQLGQSVLGIEADFGLSDLSASAATSAGQLTTSLNSIGSIRGRAGFLVSPALLVYGTAGLAWANMDFQIAGTQSQSETFFGYQVGVGGEVLLTGNVGLRLEYIYTGLPGERVTHPGLDATYDPSFSTVRAGISIRF
jgi:outer membrane immunogenic protein